MAFTIWSKHTAAKSKILFINPNFLEFAGIFDFEFWRQNGKKFEFWIFEQKLCFCRSVRCKLQTQDEKFVFVFQGRFYTLQLSNDFFFNSLCNESGKLLWIFAPKINIELTLNFRAEH